MNNNSENLIYTMKSDLSNSHWAVFIPELSETELDTKIGMKLYFEIRHIEPQDIIADLSVLPDLIFEDFSNKYLISIKQSKYTSFLLSDNFLKLLQRFRLPDYKLHDVILKNCIDDQLLENYKYIVFEGELLNHVVYTETIFDVFMKTNPKVKIDQIHGLSSAEDLSILQSKYLKKGKMIRTCVFKIDKPYDLWWGGDSHAYINEKIKDSLIENGINNINIQPFNSFKIR